MTAKMVTKLLCGVAAAAFCLSGLALGQSKVAPEDVDNVVFGNVLQTSADAIYLARHVGLRAGLPQHVPALTVNVPLSES